VQVRAYSAHGNATSGSAVLLDAERLVTNCHVTANSRDLEVVRDGRVWRAAIEARDPVHDLCILSVPGIAGAKADFSNGAVVGQKVFAAGFLDGKQLAVSSGHIVALHEYNGAKVIQVSTPFDTGASGGGLFDEQGRLIGILTFKARVGGAYHFALPAEWVTRLHPPGREYRTADSLAFWQQPPAKQPFFLRALSLELNQQWDALAALGETWTRQSPTNPHAWTALETALRNLRRMDDAKWARGEALRLAFNQAVQTVSKVDDAD
jgi:serine protease Do